MTQQQVADKTRIQLRQYQRFESGERNLSSSSFDIACKALAVLGLELLCLPPVPTTLQGRGAGYSSAV
jgi:transcriptional regulator with XRE-family HTH domain